MRATFAWRLPQAFIGQTRVQKSHLGAGPDKGGGERFAEVSAHDRYHFPEKRISFEYAHQNLSIANGVMDPLWTTVTAGLQVIW
ncbi:MAG: hypothetical protein FJ403_04775 [Verrucomicrobia bacterium]|nr:hypothetical protein [Verrucomicrobiota bacterium]